MKKTKVVASKAKKIDKKTISSDYQLDKVEDACNCGNDKCCKSNNIFKTLFFVVLLIVLGYFAFLKISEMNNLNNFKTKVIPAAVKQVIGEQKLDYKIDNVVAVSGIYKFDIVIKSNGAEQKYNSFITQDGKLFFVSGIELDQKAATANTPAEKATKMTCSDLPKKDAPKLTAFVVADCPYGLQTQRLFKKAISDIGAMAQNLEIKYIGSIENGKIISMHGDKEAQENLKQICLRDEQPNIFMTYLSCYMQEGKSEECNAPSGVNVANLKACTEDANRGLKYAAADFALADKFQVSGSPTLLLNGEKIVSEFDFGGRNVKSIKDMLCCSGSNKQSYCSATASADNISASYSKEDIATAGGSTSAANCGN